VAIEGFGQPHQRATIYALGGQGQATSIEDAVGDTTTYTYDAQHDVTSRADANNASGHDTTIHYAYTYASPDGSLGPDGTVGLLTQETSPPVGTYSPQSALAAQTTTYQYDPHTFDLVEVDKPGGGKTRYSYDGRHGRVATIELINTTSSGCGGPQAQLARPSAAQPLHAALLVGATAPRRPPRRASPGRSSRVRNQPAHLLAVARPTHGHRRLRRDHGHDRRAWRQRGLDRGHGDARGYAQRRRRRLHPAGQLHQHRGQ